MTPTPKPANPVTDLLAKFGLEPPAEAPPRHPDLEPRDDPKLLARIAATADQCADDLARKTNCPCKSCKLLLAQAAVTAFMCKETLRAAVTGDRTKIDAVAALVESLKNGGA